MPIALPALPGSAASGPLIPPSSAAPAVAAPPAPSAPNVPQGLDPKAYILTKAIAYQENGGKKPDYTIHSADDGSDPNGKTGKLGGGAFQFTSPTWANYAQKYLGDPKAALTPENQNKVAYSFVSAQLAAGKTPAQVASMWNAGQGEPDAYTGKFSNGKPSANNIYNVPKYVTNVQKYAEQLYNGQDPAGGTQNAASAPAAAAPAAPNQGGAFFPSAPTDSPLVGGLKAAGNLIPSAFNFAKNVANSFNPVTTLDTLGQIPAAFSGALSDHNGDILSTLKDTASSLLPSAYNVLMPQAGKDLVTAAGGYVTGDTRSGDAGLQAAQKDFTNDPFGSVAPFVFAGKGAAEGIDTLTGNLAKTKMADYVGNLEENTKNNVPIPSGAGTNFGGMVDNAISKIAAPITSPLETARTAFGRPSPAEAPVVAPKAGTAAALPEGQVETAGKVLQSHTSDAALGARVLGQVDTAGVKTYEDLANKLNESIKANLKQVDQEFGKDTAHRSLGSLEQKVSGEVGGVKVSAKVNYVKEALSHLQELYTKTHDLQDAAYIKAFISKAKKSGLTPAEVNMIARKYGTEFGTKAFSARTGEALTSVNARAYENVRTGLKETARSLLTDDKTKALDKSTSDMIRVKQLADQMKEKVNKLEQRVVKRNVVEKIARAAGQVIDFATFGGPKAFVQKLFFPSNVGLKTMNSLDLEGQLSKNLRLIKSFEKGDDATFANTIVKVLKATNNLPNNGAIKASVFGRPSPIQPQLNAPTQ